MELSRIGRWVSFGPFIIVTEYIMEDKYAVSYYVPLTDSGGKGGKTP